MPPVRALLPVFLLVVALAPAGALRAGQTPPAAPAAIAGQGTAARPPAPREARRIRALDRRLDRILERNDARRGFWGIEVAEPAAGKLLYQRDAGHLLIPASNMKMFTTAAALEMLGAEYVFRTTVESDAPPDAQGRVPNLYLVGRGDPNLGVRTFPYTYHGPKEPADESLQELAEQVKARGVRAITGALIGDDTYFVWEPFAPNWAADDLEWGYGAPPTALAFNDNLLSLHVKPGTQAGDPAEARLDPVAGYFQIDNRITTSAAGTEKDYSLERLPGSMQMDLWGHIPAGAAEDNDAVAIPDPPRLAAEVFRRALEARGIEVTGQVEVRHLSRLEAASLFEHQPGSSPRVVLAEHLSPPLREAIMAVNKESENLHAEMLLRTLGRVVNKQGSREEGLKVLNAFATRQVGILPGETYISDGSGLSREDLVAPHATVKLLLYMAHSANFQAFFDSLPVAGVDGTLAHRLLTDEVKGKIHAKTGSVEHVNTLSGYMDLPSGKRVAFSIMANNNPLPNKSGQETLDAVAVEIYRYFAKKL